MTVWNGQVAASSDDARENAGTVGLTASTMSLGGISINLGFRFLNVTIPKDATINSATLAVHVVDTANDDPNCAIYVEQSDDAATFTTGSNNITNRIGGSSVAWSASGIGAGFQNAPAITSLIQAIINRAGWVSGNDIVVILDGDSGTNLTVTAYDGTPANAATLTIDYTAGGISRVMHHRQTQEMS